MAGRQTRTGKQNKALDKVDTLAGLDDFDASSGQVDGMEELGEESFVLPIIALLQDNSPEVKEHRAEYIEGARPGMFLNKASKTLVDELTLVPVYYVPIWTHWHPRDEEGGLIGTYAYSDDIFKQSKIVTDSEGRKKRTLPDGTIIQDTRRHYALMMDENLDNIEPAILSLSGSQIKRSRAWLAEMRSKRVRDKSGKEFTPPTFSGLWTVDKISETNKRGDWFGYRFTFKRFLKGSEPKEKGLYENAKKLYRDLTSGTYPMITGKVAEDEPDEKDEQPNGDGF